ncbi:FAD-binding oxidoreductase [Alteromonadaceae bacterium M269]|nr:FAD-binding oxidoreductase [Alteromonadaceae bacterium M269]
MIPVVHSESLLEKTYTSFLDELKMSPYAGDIESSYSSRLAVATDNSIYQKLPQAVLLPKTAEDVSHIGCIAANHPQVKFSPRGGGTGTNGQSLTSGIVVDMSRHMNQIIEINVEEKWVRVQSGVVKDALNDFLKPHGFFFAPDLSTSNRATIGGMINTDASGQGSLVYGKTSDHVLALSSVLADGTVLDTSPIALEEFEKVNQERYQEVCAQLIETCKGKRDKIQAKFPRLNRFLTGYDLEHGISDDLSTLDVSRLITGSEGSLAFVTEAKLNITPIPKYKALVNIKYDSFESALRHAPKMVEAKATSVETVDSNVLNLAKKDIVWHSVKELISDVPNKEIMGLNIVEYTGEELEDFKHRIEQLSGSLEKAAADGESGVIGYQVTYDLKEISRIYGMRKKAVGLLGKTKGWEKPIAFAEDTAVPPENLADFIMEFRALLDEKGLYYGMFGHVDAGVLHVRPAFDMCDPKQEVMMHELSDKVVELVAKYGGLMWGEHGKGYRSEYGPAFFGDELFTELRKIKQVFDPHNQMNPGKICTPLNSDEQLVKVSDKKRGHFDKQIPINVRNSFEPALSCNGNGLCFNYDTKSPMCPSSKITADRRHSPKGRAGIMREWLRLVSEQNYDFADSGVEDSSKTKTPLFTRWANSLSKKDDDDFSHEVMEVMDGCLACKACATQCPVNVDVPSFRARFLNLYYQRYSRPLKDYLVANIEALAPFMAKIPSVINVFLRQKWMQNALKKTLGYVDTPILSVPTLQSQVESSNYKSFDLDYLNGLTNEQRKKTLLIVQDPFTSFYDAKVISDLMTLTRKLGVEPILLPFKPNGKPQHVKGFLSQFAKTARSTSEFLNQVGELGIPMVGVDPSMVLCYRDEYKKALGDKRGSFQVDLVHEWLIERLVELPSRTISSSDFHLFGHCTEKTALPKSEGQWQQIFEHFGLRLNVVSVGCCGMAGTYGHEASHLEHSQGIFGLSWQEPISNLPPEQVLATGYSCRSQVKRFEQFAPRHPLQVLNDML